jgi:hypothetical protein
MMMAHDSGSPPGEVLSAETVEALRDALSAYLRSPGETDAVRNALRVTALEAREKRILPEHLLVSLKQIWIKLPEVRAVHDPMEHAQLLQRVVTICIGEYYR